MTSTFFLAFVAFLAGAVSVLTPCVLVMLPVILAVTGAQGRRRVVGVLIGLEVSFVGISLLAGAAIDALGLPPRTQEFAAVVLIGVLGLTLLVPALNRRLELATSTLVGRMPGIAGRAGGGEGFRGGLLGGLGLGFVWAPCAGPILAAVTAGANTQGFTTRSVVMAIAYGLGMLLPLLLVMRGGHATVQRLRRRFGARRLDVVLGSVMVVTAAAIFFGGFNAINREVARLDLNSTPISGLERTAIHKADADALARVREKHGDPGSGRPSEEELSLAGFPESDEGVLSHLGPVPQLTGIHEEYNLPKGVDSLDADYLEGKVVVYDFWTYTCINCIRTLPYLRALNDRYAKDGLVIVGIHAPEFQIEKDESNVRQAIKDLRVTWPVATDPDLKTWGAFHNQYWPAKYIADRSGELRYVHFGEGGYDQTEDVIRELLGEKAGSAGSDMPAPQAIQGLTPETYVGYGRLSSDQWRGQVVGSTDRYATSSAEYEVAGGAATRLGPDQLSFTGRWIEQEERAVADGDDAQLLIHYRARRVYLVLHPPKGGAATVVVHDSGADGGGTRRVRVDRDRLYTLRDGTAPVDGMLRIEVPKGVAAYAFTFG